LQPLLEFGFGVFGRGLHGRVDVHFLEQALHQRLCRSVAPVQVDRTNQGFERVGQDGRAFLATGAQLAFAQTQHRGQLHLLRQLVQGVLLDQIGPHP